LVHVVASAKAVVDAHDGFDVDEDLLPRHKRVDDRARDRGAAHASAHQDAETDFAIFVLDQVQADVVPGCGRTVFRGAAHRNLELAGQEGELGVQGRPLTQYFAVRAGVDDVVFGHAHHGVGRDVADAVARGLDAVHVDLGQ